MRTHILLPFALALASASAFAAPQQPQTEPSMSEIQIRGVAPIYKPMRRELAEVKGLYTLDNGAILTVTVQGRTLYAQLGDRKVTEMVAIAPNRFVSHEQRMTFDYKPEWASDEVVLTYPADLNVAESDIVMVRMAMNR
jgi:hypothetical protein